jgi:uncharacterized membrane protein YjjB (DUF3815 family)
LNQVEHSTWFAAVWTGVAGETISRKTNRGVVEVCTPEIINSPPR